MLGEHGDGLDAEARQRLRSGVRKRAFQSLRGLCIEPLLTAVRAGRDGQRLGQLEGREIAERHASPPLPKRLYRSLPAARTDRRFAHGLLSSNSTSRGPPTRRSSKSLSAPWSETSNTVFRPRRCSSHSLTYHVTSPWMLKDSCRLSEIAIPYSSQTTSPYALDLKKSPGDSSRSTSRAKLRATSGVRSQGNKRTLKFLPPSFTRSSATAAFTSSSE